ncbi:MAG: hypothetical protein UHM08_08815 [Bacteroidales bacterium]|nr:hypothetical protein [Bacteroidales bacterium]
MKRVSIFKPCDITYDKYDKPVKYTEDFLKEIASNTVGTKLVDHHYGKSIGNISNITFTDGELYCDVSSSESLKKFSPSFDDLTLVDEGEYLRVTGGRLVEVASTVTPRLDNSKGGTRMADEGNDKTMEFLSKEVERLQKENAKLEFKAKQDKEKLDKLSEYEKELEDLRDWKETNEKLIEEQKPIIEAYNKQQEKNREELLETASQGNSEIKEQLKDLDNNALETIVNLNSQEQPAKGVSPDKAIGLDEGDGSDNEEAEQEERQKAVETMFGDLFEKED